MMDSALIDLLEPLARLALSYAPGTTREDWLTLLALDARLAGIVRSAGEETLARIRLAWWRERLQSPAAERPSGEPLLARLADWPDGGAGLQALVDGWEALLGEDALTAEDMQQFAQGRAEALCILCVRLGIDPTVGGRKWAFADLATHLSDPVERKTALALMGQIAPHQRLSRALRPLVVIKGVTGRAALAGRAVLTRSSDLALAMRLGLLGR